MPYTRPQGCKNAKILKKRSLIMSVYNLVFSPTGGTGKVADMFAGSFCDESTYIDLTKCDGDYAAYVFQEEDICIVSVPSYGGRVPAIAVSRLRQIRGNGARAVLIVVYGNRAYDDTFAELQDTLTDAGFVCIAAVAAVAEHSIMRQFAAGRPDAQDEKELGDYAAAIRGKIEAGTAFAHLNLPGNRPYREYGGVPMKPQAQKACNGCGICAGECPVSAISAGKPAQTDTGRCISCMRCVAVCPQKARSVNKALLAAGSMKLKKACSEYKRNELFLA